MKLTIHVELNEHSDQETKDLLNLIIKNQRKIMLDLTQITERVSAIENAGDAAIELLRSIKAELDAAKGDPAKLQELSDRLGAQTEELAAAVTENTDATPSTGGGTGEPEPTDEF